MDVTHDLAAVGIRRRARVRSAVTHRDNVLQFARFLGAGAVGYVVNLAVFAAAAHGLAIDFRLSAGISFVFALLTTFVLNRHFTFGAGDGPLRSQLARYALVNLGGLVTNLVVLVVLVSVVGVLKLPAEAIAAAVAAPVNFAGNRLWAFAHDRAR